MGMLRDNRKDELEVLGDGEMDFEKHLVRDDWKDINGGTKGCWWMMGCMLKGARE
jgi:hypothetical protein